MALAVLAAALAGCAAESGRIAPSGDWPAQAGNDGNWRYSALRRIDRGNVAGLQLAWRRPTGVPGGHEGGPLVVDGVLYLHTPYPNRVQALDPATGALFWQYLPEQDGRALATLCCDKVSRGLAWGRTADGEGRIVLQQTDTTLVALDARTGAVRWRVKNGDPALGETATQAPHVFDSHVVTGIAGGEYGVRGHITAYALADGRRLWRGYSTGPDADMLIDPERSMTWRDGRMQPVGRDSSLSSWQGDQWRQGGGTTWGWYARDRALGLLYYGSGNPATWNPVQRPGDNRWTMSLWARDLVTGAVRWVYQMTPHDEWDYDGVNELILFDADDGQGRTRRLLAHFDRNGFAYLLDRASGALVRADKFDAAVNWASHVDPVSGRPQVDPARSPQHTGTDDTTRGICPATLGAKNQAPAAYAPDSGLFFVPTVHLCMDNEVFEVNYTAGQPYTGADIHMRAVPGDEQAMGRLIAWDALRGRTVWSRDERLPLWGGALATAGGLVFYGTLEGELKAVDARDGRLLWTSPRLASGIVGNVTTWMHDGRQYIGVYAGVGGLAADPDGIARMATVSDAGQGGELAVFALPDRH